MERFTGLLGLLAIVGAAYAFSTDRRAIRPTVVMWGLGLQFLFAFLVLKTGFGQIFQAASAGVNALLRYAEEGSVFLFGPILGKNSDQFGVVFAFQVLPIIIFIAAFFAVLYYFGVMQLIIKGMAIVMRRVMGASGAESTCVAAGIFMGQTEAPLTIKPFLANLTRSELFCIMAGGMAHVSGAVMGAYVKIAGVQVEHLLTAVIMTAPATIMLAKMLIPETEQPETAGDVKLEIEKPGVNVIDAAARGAGDGVQLCLNIAGMLIAFTALIAMVNGLLGWVHSLPGMGWLPGSMQSILGLAFAPVAWLMGVSSKDTAAIGNLLGTRLVLNEFFAFIDLAKIRETLDNKSFVIATFALCGFANLSSIAIQVGGIGALAPTRKSDLARLGIRAVACGSMANFMSACIAGMLL
ncbi:MAG: NupC/NupG family nucleoside CNT transporter [Acidobacteria bacterium]|nr:NupC/NupG family nucleoside CNT transporter [Acidobacteriota bacterium]